MHFIVIVKSRKKGRLEIVEEYFGPFHYKKSAAVWAERFFPKGVEWKVDILKEVPL